MRKNARSIPVNKFGGESGGSVTIERISFEQLPDLGDWEQPERHDRHSFFLLEKGNVAMENADDVTVRLDFTQERQESPGEEEYEIERDVLLDILYLAVKDDITFFYGDSITGLQETEDYY